MLKSPHKCRRNNFFGRMPGTIRAIFVDIYFHLAANGFFLFTTDRIISARLLISSIIFRHDLILSSHYLSHETR